MKKSFFLLIAAAFFGAQALFAQQSGNLSAQQVMSALAGMRSDITLMADENRSLSLRIEALEEELAKKNNQIQDLQNLCGTLAQQNQSLETRIMDIAKAIEADQSQRQKEFKELSNDITKALKNQPAPTPQPAGPTISLTIEKGDTLSSIAKAAKCTVKEIMAANPNLKSADDLRVGQVIQVPKK